MRAPGLNKLILAISVLSILAACTKLEKAAPEDMAEPSVLLTSPNGSEVWYLDADYDITWEATDDVGVVLYKLDYSLNGGLTWIDIQDWTEGNPGVFTWTVPLTPSIGCLVRVWCQDLVENIVSDTSDAIFAIWPQGGMIAFTSDRDGDFDIFTMYADGSNPQNLTGSLGGDYFPKWSPDCSQIGFHSLRDGNYEIYTMNNDGTTQTNMSNNPAADAFLAWSPAGDRIAFSSTRRNASYYDIWIMNVDGTSQIAITANNFQEFGADWSPDGEQIVYHNNQDGDWEIFTIDSEGQDAPVRLTNNGFYDAYPAWSPDGLLIAFCSGRDGNYEIYTMNANGSNPRRITNHTGEDTHPAWSPDGSKIIFESNRTGDYELWTVDPDNVDDLQNISNDLDGDGQPSWSPIQ